MNGRTMRVVLMAFIGSVVLNVWLFLHPHREGRHRLKTPPRAAMITPRPISVLPEEVDQSLPCEDQRDMVRKLLESTQAELDTRLTPAERFDRGTPDAGAESEVRAELGILFADAPDTFKYEMECRTRVCHVVVTSDAHDYQWAERLQRPEARARWPNILYRCQPCRLYTFDCLWRFKHHLQLYPHVGDSSRLPHGCNFSLFEVGPVQL